MGYVVGLLMAGLNPDWIVWSFNGLGFSTIDFTVGMGMLMGAGAIASLLCPRFWRTGPRPTIWVMAGLVGGMAGMYMQVRSPSYDRLLQFTPQSERPTFPMEVGVQGDILDAPQLTRSGSVRFPLHVTAIQSWEETLQSTETSDRPDHETVHSVTSAEAIARVAHKVYVTVPLLKGTGLAPGEVITLHGRLYRPEATDIPGAFNFRQYLEHQGISTILKAKDVQPGETHRSGRRTFILQWRQSTWAIRQRIVRSFVKSLDSPAGPLLSAMVLGRKAVDLPFDVRDQFIQAGLAHILAASGFHVSLLLGVVLLITRRLSSRQRLWVGGSVLIGYASLTGLQPSVCRAVLMGIAVLMATATERKVRPLGTLLLIASVLLMINPVWIWDLGFQLSFLATAGLVVTVPALVKRLDWMPVGVATAIAVPIAAMVWTLPILLRMMGTILPYSVVLGVFLTPFIGLISLAGMIAGAIALIAPSVGGLLASLCYWPLHCLIAVVAWCNGLPGQAIALGSLNLWQLVAIYSVYIWVAWTGHLFPSPVLGKAARPKWLRTSRPFISLMVLTLVLIPLFYSRYQKVQITVFPTSNQAARPPFMLIQNRGRVGVINNGTVEDVEYTLLPFLRHEGINRLDWAIATPSIPVLSPSSNSQELLSLDITPWDALTRTIPVHDLYYLPNQKSISPPPTAQSEHVLSFLQPLAVGQSLSMGHRCRLTVHAAIPTILDLVVDHHHWIVMDHSMSPLPSTLVLPPSDVWYWAGGDLGTHTQQLKQLAQDVFPQQAIIAPIMPHSDVVRSLQLSSIALYSPSRHHVIQWTPKNGFLLTADGPEPDFAL